MDQIFPTGKPHVSYSEIKSWKECPWRHKLTHIEKIDLSKPSEMLFFGKIVHAACEEYLKSRVMVSDIAIQAIDDAWANNGFENADLWKLHALNILNDIPKFLDETFPGWECQSAEEMLYETVESSDMKFKGFIDGIIKIPGKGGKTKYWILDWKTSGPGGWHPEKQRDFLVQAQLALYKRFWSFKNDLKSADVACGFVLLKKGAKPGKCCQLLEISAGPTIMERAEKLFRDMITSVRKGVFVKNKTSCTYCEYKGTKYCT
jgi:hypothetical protein